MAVVCSPSQPNCPLNHMSSLDDHPDVQHDFFATAHAVNVSQEAPSDAELEAVAAYPLLTDKNEQVSFDSLCTGGERGRRVLVIFVRHFFCGNCQEYLKTLSELVRPQHLLALPLPTSIVVIGCGQPEMIPFYQQATNCPYPIYADPSRELYVRLGMARTMAPGDKKPDYVRKSMLGIVASGLTQGISAGRNALKGGDFWQVGGEFLFEDSQVTRCHRMSTTRDHVEVPTLQQWLGMEPESDDGDERISKKHRRNLISEVGASVRRSISRRRNSPSSRSRSDRKGSDTSMDRVSE